VRCAGRCFEFQEGLLVSAANYNRPQLCTIINTEIGMKRTATCFALAQGQTLSKHADKAHKQCCVLTIQNIIFTKAMCQSCMVIVIVQRVACD
jgi:hypothetical protein